MKKTMLFCTFLALLLTLAGVFKPRPVQNIMWCSSCRNRRAMNGVSFSRT